MPQQQNSLFGLLKSLAESNSQFIVVGGLAAVLHGAPVHTYDVDIVYARTPENIARLIEVLASLDAIFRIQPERKLRPTESHLSGSGHLNLLTRNGPLDLLATIGDGLSYQNLLPHSSKMDLGHGVQIQVLNLEKLIEVKEQLAGDKDIAVLPVLRHTLNEWKRQRNPPKTQS
jgi:predicted nucleotidyltransferase